MAVSGMFQESFRNRKWSRLTQRMEVGQTCRARIFNSDFQSMVLRPSVESARELIKNMCSWEFPGSPLVGTWCFHCSGN